MTVYRGLSKNFKEFCQIFRAWIPEVWSWPGWPAAAVAGDGGGKIRNLREKKAEFKAG
jgi:hypothetical protein